MTTHKVENKNIESTARKLICLKVLLWDTVKIGIIVGHQILVNYAKGKGQRQPSYHHKLMHIFNKELGYGR